MMHYTHISTPIGQILLAADDAGLRVIGFPRDKHKRVPEADWIEDAAPLRDTTEQLQAYFAGELTTFELTLAPEGTAFQLRVWAALQEIPYGVTWSYGDVARRIGRPTASRAVGAANGRNPLPIVIPCHRVIGSSGDLVGFGGGLDVKSHLLALEHARAPAHAGMQTTLPFAGASC